MEQIAIRLSGKEIPCLLLLLPCCQGLDLGGTHRSLVAGGPHRGLAVRDFFVGGSFRDLVARYLL